MEQTANTFTGGLIKDLNPIATPNDVLTDALNATLITFNGNETMLQNDMGNTNLTYYPRTWEAIESENDTATDYREVVSKIREKVKLKEGYIPIGMKEHGDIIYIVSYNPEENRTEIGSFPGPEYRPIDKIPSKEVQNQLDIKEDTLNKIYNLTEEGDTLLKPYDLISDYTMEGLSPMFISTPDNKGLYIPKYINVNTNQDITDSINIVYNYKPEFNNYKIEKNEYSKVDKSKVIEEINYTYQDKDYVLFNTNKDYILNESDFTSLEQLEYKENYNKFISYPNIKKGDIGVSYTLEDINGIMYIDNSESNDYFNINSYIPEIKDIKTKYDYIFINPIEYKISNQSYHKENSFTSINLLNYGNDIVPFEFKDENNKQFTVTFDNDYLIDIQKGTKYLLSFYKYFDNIISLNKEQYDSAKKYPASLNGENVEIIEQLISININGVDIMVPALLYKESEKK